MLIQASNHIQNTTKVQAQRRLEYDYSTLKTFYGVTCANISRQTVPQINGRRKKMSYGKNLSVQRVRKVMKSVQNEYG